MKVGIIDSGAGGLTILNAIRKKMPYLDLLYLADEAFAPYGNKSVAQLQERLVSVGRFFESEQVSALVVACNTATVAAIDALRASTTLPIVGVEPAVKPAFRLSKKRKVAVLATPVTAKSTRLNQLIERWKEDSDVVILSSDTLAFDIDSWPESLSRVEQSIDQLADTMLAQNVDTLVLACTHYPLVKSLFEQALGRDCDIIEPSEGVAAQLTRRLTQAYPMEMQAWLSSEALHLNEGTIEVCSSKDLQNMPRLRAWIESDSAIIAQRWAAI
ncbi:glutamate racemase [Marinomonas sp. IMCC 4694]|nr:glutamate racemase [Marinomonas sp. IMCC 4694]